MEIIAASDILAVLGHPARLALFRLLMRHAPQGVRPTELAGALGLKPNTLSHHLADLERVGLVRAERQGRSIFYAVHMDRTAALMAYLTGDCCRGRPDLCLPPGLGERKETTRMQRVFNVLFICSGNSARSIFAEALLRDLGAGRFAAYSAGTRARSVLNPFALDLLMRNDHRTDDLRSKTIAEFQAPDAPVMDFVFTVCDAAADEECAPWPGQPMTAHWGIADPVKATGTEAEKALAFAKAYAELRRRIAAFVELPFQELEKVALQHRLDDIGRA